MSNVAHRLHQAQRITCRFTSRVGSRKPQPKAVVCLVHGLGEHTGRYAHVAAALNDAGYAVLGVDLRGHGKSGGPRGVHRLL